MITDRLVKIINCYTIYIYIHEHEFILQIILVYGLKLLGCRLGRGKSWLGQAEDSRPHSVHWWLSHQRPVRVGLYCQARCDYHPWRQCSLYGLNLQLDNAGGSSHPCPPLDCLKRWQSDHTCHPPHRFSELATKSEKWNGKPRLECVDGRHPPPKTPVGVLPWTCRSEGKWSGQYNSHRWLASRKIWSV